MITVTFTDDTTTHTVHTRDEVLDLVDRYFPKVKIGDKVRILTNGDFNNGAEYVGSVHVVEALYDSGGVGLRTGMYGTSVLWAYYPEYFELVKE